MLPDRLNTKWSALRWFKTTSPVPFNAPEVVAQNIRIFRRVYSCLQNVTRSNYQNMQLSELLGVLAVSARLFWCISNLEPSSLGVIIIMFMSNSTIQLSIFLLHTLMQALYLNIQSSRYLNPFDHLQARCYRFYLMQHSLAPNVPVQQWLRQEQYESY